jgi:pimeloyl-ACP methyl ester carboxylesterase
MARPVSQGKRSDAVRHEGFLRHRSYYWLKVAVVLSVAAVAGYLLIDVNPRPNGGSAYGYVLGTVSALLILWLTLLGIRKRAITPGAWSLKAWVSAHVYLGLSLIALATLHTGLQFGWNVHTLAYILMLIVIVTGIYGVIVYATLPRKLSENRGETTQKQMLEGLHALDRQLLEAAQPLDRNQAAVVQMSLEHTNIAGSFLRRLTNLHGDCRTRKAYASFKRAKRTPLTAEALDEVTALLERKCAVLAQTRRHIQIRTLLSMWLYVHIPTTIALLAALTAHIVSVFFYW